MLVQLSGLLVKHKAMNTAQVSVIPCYIYHVYTPSTLPWSFDWSVDFFGVTLKTDVSSSLKCFISSPILKQSQNCQCLQISRVNHMGSAIFFSGRKNALTRTFSYSCKFFFLKICIGMSQPLFPFTRIWVLHPKSRNLSKKGNITWSLISLVIL